MEVPNKKKEERNLTRWVAWVVTFLLTAHLLGTCVSFTYFSYRYAREHSFLTWLLFGEFVPFGKSLIWEYYAFSDGKPDRLTDKEKEEVKTAYMNAEKLMEIMQAVFQEPRCLTPKLHEEFWQVMDKSPPRLQDEALKVGEWFQLLLDDVVLTVRTRVPTKSTRRRLLEQEFVKQGILTHVQIEHYDMRLEVIAEKGESTIFQEQRCKESKNALSKLLTRP